MRDKEFTSVVFTPKEAISKTLDVTGGRFFMNLSSCVQYGLLELKSREGYKPTQLFKKIQKPLTNENANDFLNECFQSPDLYKKLIEYFNEKQLPSINGLANLLDRNYGVKGVASTIAAKVFLKNAEALGLIGEGNTLKLESYIPFEENKTEEGKDNKTPPVLLIDPPKKEVPFFQYEIREIPVFLQNKREAKLTLPVDFTDDDLNRIIKVLNAYVQ